MLEMYEGVLEFREGFPTDNKYVITGLFYGSPIQLFLLACHLVLIFHIV